MKLLKELTLIKEGAEDERFLDAVWAELMSRDVDEAKIERAFSGRGASVAIEKYYGEVVNKTSGKSSDKKAIKKVADELLKKYGKVFGVK